MEPEPFDQEFLDLNERVKKVVAQSHAAITQTFEDLKKVLAQASPLLPSATLSQL